MRGEGRLGREEERKDEEEERREKALPIYFSGVSAYL